MFGEDWEWCRRFAKNGYRVVYYSGTEIIHHHGASSVNYIGKGCKEIRDRSIVCAIASTHYVYRKLHANVLCSSILFMIALRINCLSRAILYGVLTLFVSRANYGIFRGYLRSFFVSYKYLCRKYLSDKRS